MIGTTTMDKHTKLMVLELVKINRDKAMRRRIRWSERALNIRRPKKTLGTALANIFDNEGNLDIIENGYWVFKDNCGLFSFTWQMGRDAEWEFASFWTFQMVNETYRNHGLMLSIENIKTYTEDFNGLMEGGQVDNGDLLGRRHPRHYWYNEMENRINRYRDYQREIYDSSIDDIYNSEPDFI